MLNEPQKKKVANFLQDELMADTVYQVLLNSFLKPSPIIDVNILAAERMAIRLLQEGWRELGKYENKVGEKNESVGNIGV